MKQIEDSVSIETSNAWFFLMLASFVLPGLALSDANEPWGYAAVLLVWCLVLLPLYVKSHRQNIHWLSSMDNEKLAQVLEESKKRSYFHRLASKETTRRKLKENNEA